MTNHMTDYRAQATWYAWGVQDTIHDYSVDAIAFGEWFQVLAANPAGRPSIQDAYRRYAAGDR